MIENPEVIQPNKQLYVFTNATHADIYDCFKYFPEMVLWREDNGSRKYLEECLLISKNCNTVLLIKDRLTANWLNNYLTLGSLNPGNRKRWATKLGLKNIVLNKDNTIIFDLKENRLNEIYIGEYGCIFTNLENDYEESLKINDILSDRVFHQNYKK